MKTDVMFSGKTDLWETPQDFFDKLNKEFHFDLDVCALPENAKCERYYYERESIEVRFIRGRLKFGGCKDNAPFPSMVVIFHGVKEV